jgi:L-iditol 2-dehydrogenase
MRTLQLTGIRKTAIGEQAKPQITGSHDVLLRMSVVGVCGSDVHYYTTGRIGSQVVKYPFTVGHEGAATVEAVGDAVTRVRPGDHVAIEPAVSCHKCDQCMAGRPHTCRRLKFLGCPGQLEGCLADFLVMPEDSCYPIPDSMNLEEAALAEPLSIGIYAVKKSVRMDGARIAVLGAGPIGLSVMLAALAEGAAAVYVTDRLDYRVELAQRHGAAWAGNPDRVDVVSVVEEFEALQLDAVFECCGQQEAFAQGIELLKPGGKLMMIGIPEFDDYTFPADIARRKELCFQHVRRQNHCMQAAIDMIAEGRIKPQFMVTHRFPFSLSQEAFDMVDTYADGVVKAMIEYDYARHQ